MGHTICTMHCDKAITLFQNLTEAVTMVTDRAVAMVTG